MNDKILQKLLKIIGKQYDDLNLGISDIDPVYDENGWTANEREEGVCCKIDNQRDANGNDIVPHRLACQSSRTTRYVCEHYEQRINIRTGDREVIGGVFWTDAAWSSRQLNNPKLSCCNVPPPTNTPGGQFVPVEA